VGTDAWQWHLAAPTNVFENAFVVPAIVHITASFLAEVNKRAKAFQPS
jgi:hypothetical protein